MERIISKAKESYLKKINKEYPNYDKKQLLEELYRTLKSNEDLSRYIRRLKGKVYSV
jgi:ribosomal protein L20A (L18A)|tara:strand:- start:1583 stop:1753 length:171 start_codon:yes stop_codon:yes gene_type:complete